ncbi:GtrA family protein [Rhodococcus fascians]|nr:GtrA family protein [Rhodococcus fascians]
MSTSSKASSGPSGCKTRIEARTIGESALAQFTRFVIVGVSTNGVYALLFVALASLGSFTANLAGVGASTVLANELHRRHTFHATERVGWFQTQWEAGGLALIGLGLSTASLAAVHILFPGAPAYAQVAAVIAVSGAFGAARFLALRGWVFRAPNFSGLEPAQH